MTTQTTAPAVLVRRIDEVGCNDTRTEINYVAIFEIDGKNLTLAVTPTVLFGAVDVEWDVGGDDDDRRVFDDLATEHGHPELVRAIGAALMPHATIDAYGSDGDSLGAGNTVADATGVVHEHGCTDDADEGDCCCDKLTFVASLARVTA